MIRGAFDRFGLLFINKIASKWEELSGARKASGPQRGPIVEKLAADDMISLAAYLALLAP